MEVSFPYKGTPMDHQTIGLKRAWGFREYALFWEMGTGKTRTTIEVVRDKYQAKGRLMKSLLERWISDKTARYGAMEVETPIMYDYEHPALKDYLERFPARQYVVESIKRSFFLRFSACFGQFLMNSCMNISYKDLPMKMFELTRYSFRLEKSGELAGLRRLRAFTMPDLHTLCRDIKSAKEEFASQFRYGMDCLKDLGFGPSEYEAAVRFTKDFWKDKANKDWVASLARIFSNSTSKPTSSPRLLVKVKGKRPGA